MADFGEDFGEEFGEQWSGGSQGQAFRAGQAQEKARNAKDKTAEKAQQAKGMLSQTGEKVKNMAQATADTVKGAFGMAEQDDDSQPQTYQRTTVRKETKY